MLRFRVWPHDLDLNMHMNNARYLSLMDLGRVDLICRSDLLRVIAAKRWQAVIGGAMVRFRWPLTLFQSFTLSSRILGWDERWFYIEHRIETVAAAACLTVVRAAFLDRGSIVPPPTALAELGFDGSPPALPEWATQWNSVENVAFAQNTPSTSKEVLTCER